MKCRRVLYNIDLYNNIFSVIEGKKIDGDLRKLSTLNV